MICKCTEINWTNVLKGCDLELALTLLWKRQESRITLWFHPENQTKATIMGERLSEEQREAERLGVGVGRLGHLLAAQ